MLRFGARGIIEIINDVGASWRKLLIPVLALAFLDARARSCDRRFAWLLSASVATGLAIAAGYSFVRTSGTAQLTPTGVVLLLAILLVSANRSIRAR
jgi:hypothetical protein